MPEQSEPVLTVAEARKAYAAAEADFNTAGKACLAADKVKAAAFGKLEAASRALNKALEAERQASA